MKLIKRIKILIAQISSFRIRKKLIIASAAILLKANTINAQTFAEPVIIPILLPDSIILNTENIEDFDFADLDGDGLKDLVIHLRRVDTWYEYNHFYYTKNLGEETFGIIENNLFQLPKASAFREDQISNFVMIDLDNDGDLDILALGSDAYYPQGPTYSHDFFYIENIGDSNTPIYENSEVNPFGLLWPKRQSVYSMDFGDIDSDGDLDLIVSGYLSLPIPPETYYPYHNTNIAYFENIGSAENPSFDVVEINSFITYNHFVNSELYYENGQTAYFDDLNDDGLLDIFGALNLFPVNDTSNSLERKEVVLLNEGSQNLPSIESFILDPFLEIEYLTATPWYYLIGTDAMSDIDGDDDMDYFVVEKCDSLNSLCIHFYERLSNITSLEEKTETKINFSPNPVKDLVRITNDRGATNYKVINVAGQIVLAGEILKTSSVIELNLNELDSGLYIFQLISIGEMNSKIFNKF